MTPAATGATRPRHGGAGGAGTGSGPACEPGAVQVQHGPGPGI